MADIEPETNYDSIKIDPIFLTSLRGKYVELKLIKKGSANGFVQAIDPEECSMFLLQPNGNTYQTILILGHAILGISVKESIPAISMPKVESNIINLEERKRKTMSWFKTNLLPVTEKDDNILFKSVLILPPYDVKSVYSTNLIVSKQIKDLIEKMPEDFTAS